MPQAPDFYFMMLKWWALPNTGSSNLNTPIQVMSRKWRENGGQGAGSRWLLTCKDVTTVTVCCKTTCN